MGLFSCQGSRSTSTGLTGHPITSQLHRVISNQTHSLTAQGQNRFTEKTTTVPEERKPRLAPLAHRHSHTLTVLVIKFSQIPRSSTRKDSLLWAVQGCQDHHVRMTLKQVCVLFYLTKPSHLFPHQFSLHPPPHPHQNVPQF